MAVQDFDTTLIKNKVICFVGMRVSGKTTQLNSLVSTIVEDDTIIINGIDQYNEFYEKLDNKQKTVVVLDDFLPKYPNSTTKIIEDILIKCIFNGSTIMMTTQTTRSVSNTIKNNINYVFVQNRCDIQSVYNTFITNESVSYADFRQAILNLDDYTSLVINLNDQTLSLY